MPTVRAMVLEFPDDPVTWSKRTQYQFMSGASLLVAPVYEDSPIRNDIYLPAGKWIDYWAGAIVPMYPEMLYEGEKPADPVTLGIYPSGKSTLDLYEDDGTTQAYRKGGFARTLIEVASPATVDAPGDTVTVKVGAERGTYAGMPASRAYVIDAHVPVKPASVKMGPRVLPGFEPAGAGRAALDKARADFNAATEGSFFDAADRKGVLHVKIAPQRLAAGFSVTIGM